jgi:hypothetical protein
LPAFFAIASSIRTVNVSLTFRYYDTDTTLKVCLVATRISNESIRIG